MMAGYFRQLADRVLDPAPGLRPLTMVPGARCASAGGWSTTQARELDVEDVLTPIRSDADRSNIVVRDVADPTPDRASRDALTAPSASAAESIGGQPGDAPRAREDTHQTTTPPQVPDETPTPPAFHGFLPPSPTDTPKRAPLIARDEAPERTDPIATVPRRPRSMKQAPSPWRPPPDALRPAPIRPAPIRTNPQHDRRTQATDAQAAPEVHIHIGRIELTAIAPSKPARRESAASRKPMSLDEYLQHRNRKVP